MSSQEKGAEQPIPQSKREIHKITRAAGIVGTLTAISRLLGLVRVQIFSYFFGATLEADAFNAAFSLPNTFRYLLGEGSLTPIVVAVFARSFKKDSPEHSRKILNATFTLLTIILLVFTILAMCLTPYYLRLYVPGFMQTPGKFHLAVHLTILLFPQIFFLSIVAFFFGVLNASNHFLAPSLAPIVQNATVILLSVLTLWYFDAPIYAYSVTFLISGLFEILIQLPALKKRNLLPKLSFEFRQPEIKEMLFLLLPSIFGMAVYQINIFVGKFFASPIPGAVSYISYCDLLIQLPLSLFAISVGMAVVPSFSRLADDENWAELRATMLTALTIVSLLILPSAVALWILRIPIISTLFFFGAFTSTDVNATATVLSFYASGLLFFSCSRILVPSFYSLKDTRIPVFSATMSLFSHILFCSLLTPHLGAAGITLSLSISSLVNIAILFAVLNRKIHGFEFKKLAFVVARISAATTAMALILAGLLALIDDILPTNVWYAHRKTEQCLLLALLTVVGATAYYFSARILRIHEIESAKNIVWRKLCRVSMRGPSDPPPPT